MVARQVLAADPAVLADLAAVRLGESAFRRELSRVDDAGFDAPTLLPGWTRRHLVAHVGYNARALSRLVVWADTGVETPMYASAEARNAEIEMGATLRPQALRSLAEHAAIELDVRWRDLPDDRWAAPVRTAQGRELPVSETLWLRQREVWLHAVDLCTGLRMRDLPADFLERLVPDVLGAWARRGEGAGLRLVSGDLSSGRAWGADADSATAVASGALPDLVAWATGRSADPYGDGLSWSGEGPQVAPLWV
ncbi:maleylpyruvate isomerase [Quadrisphaera granulorum]|uniref:Maleylpyruvate isomerase n=1 Tax=Quadrisphaera granulorum TaxID=317664 RepID=A0A316A8S7_9ACTN|nr:maleylpyruvate isomerase family mycothiol-dependent enzyme [Quadrisphaera granulorum]PWJ54155.1 maleylpyruvate isomerase [Quadrisphaera granulorum]SZE96294.1 maleylpyruvate isomerase [Quadrisphaera granulorum]